MNPEIIEQSVLAFQNGLAHLQEGRVQEADILFAKSHELNPNNVDALTLLGVRSFQKQDYQNALVFFSRANDLAPDSVQILSNMGLVHNALLQFNEALYFLDSALELEKGLPEIFNNRGNALKGLKRYQEAEEAYIQAIALGPNYFEALSNYGALLLEEGRVNESISLLQRAIEANPNFAIAFNNLGNAFTQLQLFENAIECFERALAINPHYLDACLNFGSCLKKCKQNQAAVDCYQHALSLNPNNDKIYFLLADVYYEIGNCTLAKNNYEKCLEINPQNLEAQFALTVAQIPKVYEDLVEVETSRKSFLSHLEFLKDRRLPVASNELREAALTRHPFYLAYQDQDNKALLSEFGDICVRCATPIQDKLIGNSKNTKSKQKTVLGIVSHHFYDHPVWHAITKGWLTQLDPELFEIILFNTNGAEDQETELAKAKSSKYINCGNSLNLAADMIANEHLDVLVYPEIGMDPTSKGLACLRLAPTQGVSWGHPETTGLPTIDFFLSANLLESESPDAHYRERLIMLPGLGTYFEQPTFAPIEPDFKRLGISTQLPLLLCPGSPSKYMPTHDDVFVSIAKKLGMCQFIFFNFDENLTGAFEKRLHQAFAKEQLNANDYVHFIPFLQKEEFFGLMKKADLYLDTIGFSGFNTAMQAISCDLPIVTLEGTRMRGRLASGILRALNLDELICKTKAAYIDLAVQLIQSPNMRYRLKDNIAKSKETLFNNLAPIRALESFLSQHKRM